MLKHYFKSIFTGIVGTCRLRSADELDIEMSCPCTAGKQTVEFKYTEEYYLCDDSSPCLYQWSTL